MGCLRCRSFSAKEPVIIRLFLRKMTCKDKASYGSSPTCNTFNSEMKILKKIETHLFLFTWARKFSKTVETFETEVCEYSQVTRVNGVPYKGVLCFIDDQ